MEEERILSELQEIRKLKLLESKQALTLEDASLLSGLSKSHLYKEVWKKKIPYYKPNGKLLYFDKDELTKWLLSHRVKTVDELETEAANYLVTGKAKKAKKGGKDV